MSVTIDTQETLGITRCPNCGIVHAIPEVVLDNARKFGGFWYCPTGHHIGWDKKDSTSENDRLRSELAQKNSQIEIERTRTEAAKRQVKTAKRQTAAVKGQLTKTQKRIGNGVCPCCNRHFVNVNRHMQTKHPEFKNAEVA